MRCGYATSAGAVPGAHPGGAGSVCESARLFATDPMMARFPVFLREHREIATDLAIKIDFPNAR